MGLSRPGTKAAGILQLTHPFPSALDAVATAVLVLFAGGALGDAIRLGAAMFCLQGSIGALNDWRDASADRTAKPDKPIATGAVSRDLAAGIAVVAGAVGIAFVLPSGPLLLALAIGGLLAGYAYDLWLSASPWSWLPWAVGIPILPVFGWLGGSNELPRSFLLLVPLAAVAATALSIGNSLADLEGDAAAGGRTIAVALGRVRAWRTGVALHGGVLTAAIASVVGIHLSAVTSAGSSWAIGFAGVLVGGAIIGVGLILGSNDAPEVRETGWEVQAIGVGALAVGWLLAVGA